MAYEKRDGDIAIFAETDKRNDRAPDWKGDALIDGKTYEVALWAKGGRGTMLAGQIKLKEARTSREDARDRESFRGGGDDRFSGGGSDLRRADPLDPDDTIPFASPYSIR